jgi:hypothetical protein
MADTCVPFNWPSGWTDARFLRETPVNCVIGATVPLEGAIRSLDKPPKDVGVVEGVWARIRTPERGSGGGGGAGPTGRPWVESNGWRIQLQSAMNPAKPVWIAAAPPAAQVLRSEAYVLMAADILAHGGQWITTLDDRLAKGLAAGDTEARRHWQQLTTTLRLFSAHPDWAGFDTVASIGVISDFAGDNEFLGHELLNLAARRPLPLRILPKNSAADTEWQGLSAVVFVEAAKPAAGESLLRKLTTFVEGGGVLIAPAPLVEGRDRGTRHEYKVWSRGKGTICVPLEEWSDPWQLAADIHLLVGREADVLRVYNATSANLNYVQSADGKHGVVHVLSYTTRAPASGVTIALRKKWKSARLITPDQPEGRALPVGDTRFGVEIALPPFPVYAAIEMEA